MSSKGEKKQNIEAIIRLLFDVYFFLLVSHFFQCEKKTQRKASEKKERHRLLKRYTLTTYQNHIWKRINTNTLCI